MFIIYIYYIKQGTKDNLEAIDEGQEEAAIPVIDFDNWQDDANTFEHNTKSDGNYKPFELMSKDKLEETTRNLVPEQRIVLQKVLDMAKTTVQCKNSGLARDAPIQLGLIVNGGGGWSFHI